jgi:hypothetical protein
MLTRRRVLVAGTSMVAAAGFAGRVHSADDAALQTAMDESDVMYLTPIRSDGKESRCQAEVWFVHHESDLYVVTADDAWRAQAIAKGLTRTRIWVGDVGAWRDSEGAYRTLPQIEAVASQIPDAETQNSVLDAMGGKYSVEWFVWGPRFRNGLADGSRVMLRYQPVTV